MLQNIFEFIKRAWRTVAHPERRGPPDPAWAQIAVAMIAIGAVVVSVAAVTARTDTTASGSVLRPNQLVLWVGVALAAIGVAWCGVLAFTALMRWREDRKTPFMIAYDAAEVDCNEDPINGMPWQQVRIAVTNNSDTGVQRVRAFLRVLEGEGRNFFLHLQHDNDPLRHLSRTGEYVTTRQTVYFDLALVKRDLGWFFFSYADPAISDLSKVALSPKMWTFRIEVSGWTDARDVVPVSQEFHLHVDKKGVMTLATA